MKKNIIIIGYTLVSLLSQWHVYAIESLSQDDLKSAIIPNSSTDVLTAGTATETGEGFLDAVLGFLRDSIFSLLVLIAIGMFLFIGGRLIMARGNPEEFKKAMKSFVYAIIGILTVSLAWALVRLITGIDL